MESTDARDPWYPDNDKGLWKVVGIPWVRIYPIVGIPWGLVNCFMRKIPPCYGGFRRVNQLFLWPCSIVMLCYVCAPEGIWLVVWNMFYFPIYWVSNHPNWRTHIFQRGGPTTNQVYDDRGISQRGIWSADFWLSSYQAYQAFDPPMEADMIGWDTQIGHAPVERCLPNPPTKSSFHSQTLISSAFDIPENQALLKKVAKHWNLLISQPEFDIHEQT